MADLLDTASAFLESQRKKHASRLVTYQRGAWSVTVSATLGKSEFEVDDGAGATIRVESRDYLIAATDLVLDDVVVLPVKGDLIVDQELTCEVLSPDGQSHWRYTDPYRRTLRIHTKQVER